MDKQIRTALLLLLTLTFLSDIIQAQSGLCDACTPFFIADLSGDPSGTYISDNERRCGTCCGDPIGIPPSRCVEFEVTLGPGAIGLVFDIYSGASPGGSLFYQVDCSDPTFVCDELCLAGQGPYTITFCKPGNNKNAYIITSIPGEIASIGTTVKAECEAEISASGIIESSVVWNRNQVPQEQENIMLI